MFSVFFERRAMTSSLVIKPSKYSFAWCVLQAAHGVNNSAPPPSQKGNSVLLCEPINDHLMMSASESDNSWKIWDLRMYSNINTSAGGTTASSSSSSSSCIPFPSSSSESSVTYRSSSASLISCILMASSISVYCGDQQGQLREWDLRMYNKNSTSSSYGCVSVRNAHSDSVRELQLSEDGLCLVSASRDHTIKLWSRFALSTNTLRPSSFFFSSSTALSLFIFFLFLLPLFLSITFLPFPFPPFALPLLLSLSVLLFLFSFFLWWTLFSLP